MFASATSADIWQNMTVSIFSQAILAMWGTPRPRVAARNCCIHHPALLCPRSLITLTDSLAWNGNVGLVMSVWVVMCGVVWLCVVGMSNCGIVVMGKRGGVEWV